MPRNRSKTIATIKLDTARADLCISIVTSDCIIVGDEALVPVLVFYLFAASFALSWQLPPGAREQKPGEPRRQTSRWKSQRDAV
jgi:hypothetical protein